MSEPIQFKNVSLGYRRRVVLANLNFSIRAGEFFGIVGANGSGKTTLLRGMLGILPPSTGRIELRRADGPVRFGYVPQREAIDEIFPLTAREIVVMGCHGRLGPFRRPAARERALAEQCLAQTGLAELANTRYRDLSGGQKQRVLLARALAVEPNVLALDEPTTGMDLEGELAILGLIEKLRAERGVTVVFVSHRLGVVANAAQRLMLIHEGDVRIGPAEEILTPDTLREVYGVDVRVRRVDGKWVIVW